MDLKFDQYNENSYIPIYLDAFNLKQDLIKENMNKNTKKYLAKMREGKFRQEPKFKHGVEGDKIRNDKITPSREDFQTGIYFGDPIIPVPNIAIYDPSDYLDIKMPENKGF